MVPAVTTQVTHEHTGHQTVTDAYVYLIGRAAVIWQQRTDLKEPGVTHNTILFQKGVEP